MRNLSSARSSSPHPGRWAALLLVPALVSGCGSESGQAQDADAPAADVAQDPSQEVFDLSGIGIDEGSRMTSSIGVVDFSDFGCIYCANFHNGDYPVLHEEFVVPGDVLWKYVPISVGGFPNGDLAGVTGICADEVGAIGDFAEMRDILFVERDDWLGSTPTQARELFVSYAETVGLEAEAFTACIDGDAAAERLERNNQMARQVGVTATPTFIVQGSPVRGAPPLEDFQNAIRRLIAEASGQPLVEADDPDA